MLFNAMPQMSLGNIRRIDEMIITSLEAKDFKHEDEEVSLMLLRACTTRELSDFETAERLFTSISDRFRMKEETWVQPYAMYEHAVLKFYRGCPEEGQHMVSLVGQIYSGEDYNFALQLGWRVHLTTDMLR